MSIFRYLIEGARARLDHVFRASVVVGVLHVVAQVSRPPQIGDSETLLKTGVRFRREMWS